MVKSLKLFGVVIAAPDDAIEEYGDTYSFEQEYGVVVAPSAMHCIDEIRAFLQSNELSTSQLNNTSFFTSWQTVATVDLEERLRHQITHYFTTYGLQSLGLASPEFIYLPVDPNKEDAPERLALRVIRGVSKDELIAACMSMLTSGIALKQETIEDILVVLLDQCTYTFTGNEDIQNREAMVLIADRAGVLPHKADDLFRYFIYKATGASLIIKNDESIAQITASEYLLPQLSTEQEAALAASFNRRKPLWLAFKKSNPANRTVVNRISKLSKSKHVPLPVNVLGSLTSTVFTDDEVRAALRRANIYQIIRALNAIRFYQKDNSCRFYRIRNGKSYARHKDASLGGETLQRYHDLLLAHLHEQCAGKRMHTPEHIEYALPVSEKMFTGDIPKYSRVCIPTPAKKEHILIGIYWENGDAGHVDLDLSAIALSGKVGWDASWNKDGELMYSGDITNAPNGATEWLYGQTITDSYLVTLNAFSAPSEQQFKIIVGYGSRKKGNYQNYMIDPNKVMFSVDSEMAQKQLILGLLQPMQDGEGIVFYLVDQFAGNRIVSSYSENEAIAREALIHQVTSALMARDVVATTPTAETRVLSRDEIVGLFT